MVFIERCFLWVQWGIVVSIERCFLWVQWGIVVFIERYFLRGSTYDGLCSEVFHTVFGGIHYGEVEGLVSIERWSCNRGASCVVGYTTGRLRDWSL